MLVKYKINIRNSVIFLYINIEQSKNKIKEIIPLTIESENIIRNKFNKRSLKIILLGYKTLLKVIQEDLSKWKEIPSS